MTCDSISSEQAWTFKGETNVVRFKSEIRNAPKIVENKLVHFGSHASLISSSFTATR